MRKAGILLAMLLLASSHRAWCTTIAWTSAHGPYNITADMNVASGDTLEVEAGTVVNGNGFRLRVSGVLRMLGTTSEPVRIDTWVIGAGPGATEAAPFRIEMSHCRMVGGSLYYYSAGPGSISVQDSALIDLGPEIYLWYPVADCIFERNQIINSRITCILGTSGRAVRVFITNNLFYSTRLLGPDTPLIQNSGCYDGSEVLVRYNTFLNTNIPAVGLRPDRANAAMVATDNCWSTVDEWVIQSMVLDRDDDSSFARTIPYHPILAQPHPDTPLFYSRDIDQDGDGLSGYDEFVTYGTDMLKADTDSDGVRDADEVNVYHSDPKKADTDDDGMGDRWGDRPQPEPQ